MEVRILAALPKLSIEDSELTLEDARLVHLPFEEILALEGQSRSGAYNKLEFMYTRHPSVFFEKWIEVPDEISDLNPEQAIPQIGDFASEYINLCYYALLLYSAKSIFSPFLSAQYFDYRSKNNFLQKPSLEDQFGRIGAYRIYGESEKEFVFVNESPVWQISAAETGHFSRFYSFILSRSKIIFHEGMQNTLDTLTALSLPGLSDSTRIILMTGALESLLIPDLKTQINAGFTKRFIHLCHNHSETDLVWMALTYRMRSELIHGKSIESLLNRLPFDQSHYLIVLKQVLIISLCKILQYIQSSVDFENQLTTLQKSLSFDKDSEELKECMALANYKGKQGIIHQWEI